MEFFDFLYFSLLFFNYQILRTININGFIVALDFIGALSSDMFCNILPIPKAEFLNSFKQKKFFEGIPRTTIDVEIKLIDEMVSLVLRRREAKQTVILVVREDFCILSYVFITFVTIHLTRWMFNVLLLKKIKLHKKG